MTIDDKIRYEKLQIIWTKRLEWYKILSGEIDKYEYLKCYIMVRVTFICFPLETSFVKQRGKQNDVLNPLNLPDKIDELKQIERML